MFFWFVFFVFFVFFAVFDNAFVCAFSFVSFDFFFLCVAFLHQISFHPMGLVEPRVLLVQQHLRVRMDYGVQVAHLVLSG